MTLLAHLSSENVLSVLKPGIVLYLHNMNNNDSPYYRLVVVAVLMELMAVILQDVVVAVALLGKNYFFP